MLCTEPKIAWIGNDPREWEDEILHPWRHHIRSSDVVRLDCVMPTPPKSDVEEHTAHILVTLNPTQLEPILVSLEFQGIGDDEVLVRFALLTPKSIAKQDLIDRLPLLRQIEDRRVDWTGSGFDEGRDQIMRVRNGMCVRISIQPELNPPVTPPLDDTVALMQLTNHAEGLPMHLKPPLAMPDDVGRGSPTDNLTEEFLQAVEAVRTAGEQEPPPTDPDQKLSKLSGTDSPNR